MIQKMVRILGTAVILGNTMYAVEIESPEAAVNIAGKQRMYTQRMLKDYAMVGMGNTFGDPGKDLKNTMQNFQSHLNMLESFVSKKNDKEAMVHINNIQEMWGRMKQTCEAKPELSVAMTLQKECNVLLKESDALVKAIDHDEAGKEDSIIDISGRQRMLSQRMAALYMLKVWGVRDAEFHEKLMGTIGEFQKAHEVLKQSKLNDTQIDQKLKLTERAFMFFQMMSKSKSKFIPSLIYKKSNDILKKMDSVTQMYAKKLEKN